MLGLYADQANLIFVKTLRVTCIGEKWPVLATWGDNHEAMLCCRYREEWLTIRIPRVRTLRHGCKLALFKAVGRRAVLIDELPLPRPLKRYLQDTEC